MIDEPNISTTRLAAWRVWLPAVLMTAVAVVQIVLAATTNISPWKGGGFGLFSTLDGKLERRVRIFVEAPGRSEELEIAPSQEILAERARLFPSESMLLSLAKAVSRHETESGRPVNTVTLEVRRTEFSDTLEATDRRLRTLSWNVDQETYNSR